MKAPRLSPRDRRTLVAGAAIVAALVLGAKGIPAWLAWTRATRDEAREMVAEAARARASVEGATPTRDSLAVRYKRYLALAPRLLDATTPAGGGAALSSVVAGAAAGASAKVASIQIRADSAGPAAFTRVAVRADVVCDVRGLVAMLAALERGQLLVTVPELAVTSPDPGAGDDRPEMLHVQLLVEALVLNRRTKEAR